MRIVIGSDHAGYEPCGAGDTSWRGGTGAFSSAAVVLEYYASVFYLRLVRK